MISSVETTTEESCHFVKLHVRHIAWELFCASCQKSLLTFVKRVLLRLTLIMRMFLCFCASGLEEWEVGRNIKSLSLSLVSIFPEFPCWLTFRLMSVHPCMDGYFFCHGLRQIIGCHVRRSGCQVDTNACLQAMENASWSQSSRFNITRTHNRST